MYGFFGFEGDGAIASCDGSGTGVLCAANPKTLTATQVGVGGVARADVSFEIGNFYSLSEALNSGGQIGPNGALKNVGYYDPDFFTWGLPFLFGKTTFFVLDGAKSPMGTGPMVAY
jgi:hypothetical protein